MPTTPSDDAPRRTTGGFRAWIEQRFGLATESGAPAPEDRPPDPNHNPEAYEAFIHSAPEVHRFDEDEFFTALEGLRRVHQRAPEDDEFSDVRAVGYLSVAYRVLPVNSATREEIAAAADNLMERYEIANVLATIEELIDSGFGPAGIVTPRGRMRLVLLLIELRRAAREGEYTAEPGDGTDLTAKLHVVTDDCDCAAAHEADRVADTLDANPDAVIVNGHDADCVSPDPDHSGACPTEGPEPDPERAAALSPPTQAEKLDLLRDRGSL